VKSHKLGDIAARTGVEPARVHDALADAVVTAQVLPHLLQEAGVQSPDQLSAWFVA
jgi:DNA polymerase III epsilon subunit-like protein